MNQNNEVEVQSAEVVAKAILDLINTFPEMPTGETVKFASLSADGGIAMFPTSGSIVERQTKFLYGAVEKFCLYPFIIIYQASRLGSDRRIDVQEWLDKLGKWLEKQPIVVGTETYQIQNYPELTGTRKILDIERRNTAALLSVENNRTEKWQIQMSVRYWTQYQR